MKTTLLTSAAASPFAHLLALVPGAKGRASRAARAAEDDGDDEPKKDHEEAARAEDSDEDEPKKDDAKKSKRRARAEDDDVKDPEDPAEDKPVASDSDDEEDEPKKDDARKGRKAKAEDDEDCAEEGDDDDDIAAAARAGRLAERARGRKIFSSKAAAARPDFAAQLAFTTNLSSAEAIALLESAAAGGMAVSAQPSRLHQRMARVATPDVGHDVDEGDRKPDSVSAAAKAIVGALNKAQGRKA